MTTAAEPPIDRSSADHPPVRPVVGFHGRQAQGYYDPPHLHDRAQFSYRLEGMAAVRAGDASIVLPPGRGVWIPPGMVHEVSCRGPAAYNALYVTPQARPFPQGLRVLDVTPFLHALIEEFLTFDPAYDEDGREGAIVSLMLGEIERAPTSVEGGPRLPRDPRLLRVCEALRADLSDNGDIDAWAAMAGMSRRTFTRNFRQETGLGLHAWRQQLRMTAALGRLGAGESIPDVAHALGFSSISAFAARFARSFGMPPGRYVQSKGG
jgi:AraC-like DNA-binding protein